MSDQPHHLISPSCFGGRVKKHSLNALLTDLPRWLTEPNVCFIHGFPSQAGLAQTRGAAGPSPARRDTVEGQGGGRASGAAGASPGTAAAPPAVSPGREGAASPERLHRSSPTETAWAERPHRSGHTGAAPPPPPQVSRGGPRCAGRAGAGGTARGQPSPPSLRPMQRREPQLILRWSSAPAVSPRSASSSASPSSPPGLVRSRIPRGTAALPAAKRLGFKLCCQKEKCSLSFFIASPSFSLHSLAGWGRTVWWWSFLLRIAKIPT